MQRAFTCSIFALAMLAAAHLFAADAPRKPEPTIARFDVAHQFLRSGDEARDKGDTTTAIFFYDEAVKEYDALMAAFPDWEPAVTSFRSSYCRDERQKLKNKLAARAAATAPPPARTPPAATAATPPSAGVSPGLPLDTATPTNAAPAPTLAILLPKARDLMRQGKSTEARDVLMQAIRLEPDDMTARFLVATVQCQLGNYEDALFVLETLNEERPNDVATLLALSAAFLGIGQPDRAAGFVRQALQVDPDSAEAHYNLARVLLVTKPPQPTEAEIHYERAIELGAAPDSDFKRLLADAVVPAPAAVTNTP
ncbi:MAG: tetratricopeptide repeat protein [Lentisphaerae bacterium]|nr:tetratricopeptide repeat protein [Lentisphaerota bacterium]